MKSLDKVKEHLKPGEVYHRADLKKWSTSIDRHLQELVKDGTIEKLFRGIYYVPSQVNTRATA